MLDWCHMDEVTKSACRSLPIAAWLGIGFVLGMIGLIGLRFATLQDATVHYHANYALYVNGVRDEFKSFTFYEEIQSCSSDDADNIKAKVHMHDQESELVHVHQAGTTWGQFFANMGYGLSNKAITTDAGVFVDDQDSKQLTFILNGQPTTSVANQIIKSEDVLLISYGNEDNETLQKRADDIPRTAAEANRKDDPASCAGSHKMTTTERLKAAVGLGQKVVSH